MLAIEINLPLEEFGTIEDTDHAGFKEKAHEQVAIALFGSQETK